MSDIATTELPSGQYAFRLKGTSEWRDDVEAVKIHNKKSYKHGVFRKDETLAVLEDKKHDYDHHFMARIIENRIDGDIIDISERIDTDNSGGGNKIVLFIKGRSGAIKQTFEMSYFKLEKMIKDIYSYYGKGLKYEFKDMDLCNEVKVIIVLLNSENYMITSDDMKLIGMNSKTIWKLFISMERRNIIQKTEHKMGKSFIYTGVLPRDELRALFGRS